GVYGDDHITAQTYRFTIEEDFAITATYPGLLRRAPRHDLKHQGAALGRLEPHDTGQVRRQRRAADPQPGVLVGFGLEQNRYDLLDNDGGDGKADTDRHSQGGNNGIRHPNDQTTVIHQDPS